jgi:hypothetical protein
MTIANLVGPAPHRIVGSTRHGLDLSQSATFDFSHNRARKDIRQTTKQGAGKRNPGSPRNILRREVIFLTLRREGKRASQQSSGG